jgi:hypothetical protein
MFRSGKKGPKDVVKIDVSYGLSMIEVVKSGEGHITQVITSFNGERTEPIRDNCGCVRVIEVCNMAV